MISAVRVSLGLEKRKVFLAVSLRATTQPELDNNLVKSASFLLLNWRPGPKRPRSPRMLSQPALETFRTSLRGSSFCPGQQGYGEAREIHNAMIDRRPAIIVRCAGVADVIAAVKFAREHDVAASVRGTGHNVSGTSLREGGLTIDLFLAFRESDTHSGECLTGVAHKPSIVIEQATTSYSFQVP
jgi:hypothetical protein